ncbi:MAG: hypothetical protein QM784_10545 [Polyangiaceae bacterium]
MARVMIWPDLYQEHGHWMPCINLAGSLIDANHQVEFMGIPDCASIVAPYQGVFNEILENVYPRGYSIENDMEPKGQRWKPEHLMTIVRGALDGLFARNSSHRPALLISGYFNALETLMIYWMYEIPILTITTYLRHPSEDPAMLAKTKLLYMPRAMSRAIIERRHRSFGTDRPRAGDEHRGVRRAPGRYEGDHSLRKGVRFLRSGLETCPERGVRRTDDRASVACPSAGHTYARIGERPCGQEAHLRELRLSSAGL